MRNATVGWLFVLAQAVLFVVIALLPSADHWDRPLWLLTVAGVLMVAGIVIGAVAALGLGTALTPSPVPNRLGELQTDGLYALARHPIYTGVLLVIVGLGARSGNALTAGLVVVSIAFFWIKSSWEERRLAERYDGYEEYAARTARFFPHPGSFQKRASSPTPPLGGERR